MLDTAEEAPRLLPLEGGFNLRDLGGYASRDGRRVKRGLLYRSGTMAHLTTADEAHLAGLRIATVIDLRRPNERAAEPTRWCEPAGVAYWSRDYQESSGVLAEVIGMADPTGEDMHRAMLTLYRRIAQDHAPSFRAMFERLIEGDVPLLFNCVAGKDRTGVAAALILASLDVPHDVITADYLLTNDADFGRLFGTGTGGIAQLWARAPELAKIVLAADADYLDAFFEELDAGHGGTDGYLLSLGVDAEGRDRLRAMLLD